MSGGSSETEVKALAVRPVGRPSRSHMVMTVTPDAKWLKVVAEFVRRDHPLFVAGQWRECKVPRIDSGDERDDVESARCSCIVARMVTQDAVLDALRAVKDPEAQQDIVSLGLIRDLTIAESLVTFTLAFTNQSATSKATCTAWHRARSGGSRASRRSR